MESGATGRRPRYLIVDDNAGVRGVVRRLLGCRAEEVLECQDGEGAVEAYGRAKPELVLMDVSMPGMGGIEATRAIVSGDPAALVLLVTDYDDEGMRQMAVQVGACGVLGKERLSGLPQLVERLVGGGGLSGTEMAEA